MAIKINFVVRLQHWMDSVPGQTFLNYAYSWGAAIVILGALFKLTHLPGGNIMLFIGMGTEVVVFTLSAFDRPFDKTEVGKELPHDYETDEEIAARLGLTDDEEDEEEENETEDLDNATPAVQPQVAGCVPPASPTIIIGGNGASASASAANAAAVANVAAVDPVEAARAAIAAGTPEAANRLKMKPNASPPSSAPPTTNCCAAPRLCSLQKWKRPPRPTSANFRLWPKRLRRSTSRVRVWQKIVWKWKTSTAPSLVSTAFMSCI